MLSPSAFAWCHWCWRVHCRFHCDGLNFICFELFVSASMEIVFGQKINRNDLVGPIHCVRNTMPNINSVVRCSHYVKFHQFLIKSHFCFCSVYFHSLHRWYSIWFSLSFSLSLSLSLMCTLCQFFSLLLLWRISLATSSTHKGQISFGWIQLTFYPFGDEQRYIFMRFHISALFCICQNVTSAEKMRNHLRHSSPFTSLFGQIKIWTQKKNWMTKRNKKRHQHMDQM